MNEQTDLIGRAILSVYRAGFRDGVSYRAEPIDDDAPAVPDAPKVPDDIQPSDDTIDGFLRRGGVIQTCTAPWDMSEEEIAESDARNKPTQWGWQPKAKKKKKKQKLAPTKKSSSSSTKKKRKSTAKKRKPTPTTKRKSTPSKADRVFAYLKGNGTVTVKQTAEALGETYNRANALLAYLVKQGRASRPGRGLYEAV